MYDEISIAADRGGEMRVAAQVESKMSVILGGVLGLRLGAQNHLVHELLDVTAFDVTEHPVEMAGGECAAARQRDIKRVQEFAQRLDLLGRRFVVHPIDQRSVGA